METKLNELSYLQKTKDAYLYNNVVIEGNGFVDIATNTADANRILSKDGIVLLKNIINLDELENIRKYARSMRYTGDKFDTVIKDKHNHIVFAKGRQDMWPINLPLTIPTIITDLLDHNMHCEYKKSSIGALILDKNTNHTGKWHRDVLSLFTNGDMIYNDIFTRNLPNFYFTVFMPLTNSVKENGATEVLLGSHNSANKILAVAEGSPGDVMVMNGKTIHRSVPNMSNTDRDVLYIIYCAKWYDEEKF